MIEYFRCPNFIQNNRTLKNIVLCPNFVQFMLINVNENSFLGLLIQLIQINLQNAGLLQVEDGPK